MPVLRVVASGILARCNFGILPLQTIVLRLGVVLSLLVEWCLRPTASLPITFPAVIVVEQSLRMTTTWTVITPVISHSLTIYQVLILSSVHWGIMAAPLGRMTSFRAG